MTDLPTRFYQSFLIRCWLINRAAIDGQPTWRFTIREISSEPQEHSFGDLDQLMAFLAGELMENTPGNEAESEKGGFTKGVAS